MIPREILKETLQAFKPWVKYVANFMLNDPRALDQLEIDKRTSLLPQELYQGPYGCLGRIFSRYKEINDKEMVDFLKNIFRGLIKEIKPETPPKDILRMLVLLRLFSKIIDGYDLCKILLERYIDFATKNFRKCLEIYPHHITIVLKDLVHDTSEITKCILDFILNTDFEFARLVLLEILARIRQEEESQKKGK